MKPVKPIPQFFPCLALVILVGASMISAGCTGTPGTVAGVVADYKSNISSLDSYSMTVIQTASWGSQDIEILYKRPYQYLLKHRYNPTGRTWIQSVHNLTWIEYNPESRSVDILAINNPESCFPLIADPNRLASPVLFSGNYNLSDLAWGTVNGREAYRIDAVNTGYVDYFGEGRGGRVRLWIDREFWLVTRIQAFDALGKMVTTYEVKNFTINPGISDDEFIISYPEGTIIHHPNPFC
jgi:outer membrane lipoprotein-sorting protein